jgi:hypothetical protein
MNAVKLRPARITALTLVIVAALLQLSFGSRATIFRAANGVILIVATFVLAMLVVGGRRR